MEANKQFGNINQLFSENEELFRRTVAFLKKFNLKESLSIKIPGLVLYDISHEDLMSAIKSCKDEKTAEAFDVLEALEILLENTHVSFSHLKTWTEEEDLEEKSGDSLKDRL